MPYIKIPEFKHGEKAGIHDFNTATSNIQSVCDNLDGTNFKDESLGGDEVPEKVSLTDDEFGSRVKKKTDNFDQLGHSDAAGKFNPFSYPVTLPFTLYKDYNWPFADDEANKLTLDNLQVGEKAIIRTSFRINVPDHGARTYYYGVPPILKVALFKYEGDPADITHDSYLTTAKMIRQTEKRYRFAFTDKMPSASSLSMEALDDYPSERYEFTEDGTPYRTSFTSAHHHARDSYLSTDYTSGLWYRDNRGPSGDDKNPSDSVEAHHPISSGVMNFPAQFNYTVGHLYEHDGAEGASVTFFVICYIGQMEPGMDRVSGFTPGGAAGCYAPFRLPFDFLDFSIISHPVRR